MVVLDLELKTQDDYYKFYKALQHVAKALDVGNRAGEPKFPLPRGWGRQTWRNWAMQTDPPSNHKSQLDKFKMLDLDPTTWKAIVDEMKRQHQRPIGGNAHAERYTAEAGKRITGYEANPSNTAYTNISRFITNAVPRKNQDALRNRLERAKAARNRNRNAPRNNKNNKAVRNRNRNAPQNNKNNKAARNRNAPQNNKNNRAARNRNRNAPQTQNNEEIRNLVKKISNKIDNAVTTRNIAAIRLSLHRPEYAALLTNGRNGPLLARLNKKQAELNRAAAAVSAEIRGLISRLQNFRQAHLASGKIRKKIAGATNSHTLSRELDAKLANLLVSAIRDRKIGETYRNFMTRYMPHKSKNAALMNRLEAALLETGANNKKRAKEYASLKNQAWLKNFGPVDNPLGLNNNNNHNPEHLAAVNPYRRGSKRNNVISHTKAPATNRNLEKIIFVRSTPGLKPFSAISKKVSGHTTTTTARMNGTTKPNGAPAGNKPKPNTSAMMNEFRKAVNAPKPNANFKAAMTNEIKKTAAAAAAAAMPPAVANAAKAANHATTAANRATATAAATARTSSFSFSPSPSPAPSPSPSPAPAPSMFSFSPAPSPSPSPSPSPAPSMFSFSPAPSPAPAPTAPKNNNKNSVANLRKQLRNLQNQLAAMKAAQPSPSPTPGTSAQFRAAFGSLGGNIRRTVYNAPKQYLGNKASAAGRFASAQVGRVANWTTRRALVSDARTEKLRALQKLRDEALARNRRKRQINEEIRALSSSGPRPENYRTRIQKLAEERRQKGGGWLRSFLYKRLR